MCDPSLLVPRAVGMTLRFAMTAVIICDFEINRPVAGESFRKKSTTEFTTKNLHFKLKLAVFSQKSTIKKAARSHVLLSHFWLIR